MVNVNGGWGGRYDRRFAAACCDFTQLVLQTLCKDEFAKKVTAVELALGEEQLVGASATVADSGVSLDAELIAGCSEHPNCPLRRERSITRAPEPC